MILKCISEIRDSLNVELLQDQTPGIKGHNYYLELAIFNDTKFGQDEVGSVHLGPEEIEKLYNELKRCYMKTSTPLAKVLGGEK